MHSLDERDADTNFSRHDFTPSMNLQLATVEFAVLVSIVLQA